MRREIYRMEQAEALRLIERAPVVHLAAVAADGTPILRTVHGVLVDGAMAFHGAPAGEKLAAIGRPVVIGAEEQIAQIPSYFIDAERACPATTYYLSAQIHGLLEEVEDPGEKAEVLAALMARFQPEGGHVPIRADSPLYRKAVAGILVLRVRLNRAVIDGKGKLGQNRSAEDLGRVVEQLWQRGHAGDARAIELVRRANPSLATPAFLRAPVGVRLSCAVDERDLESAVDLIAGAYWNVGVSREALGEAHRRASAWVGAHDEAGRLIATARALSDGAKHAWIYDVMVHPLWRGRGLGRAIMRLLLDHPPVRRASQLHLRTRDAMAFYRTLGFVDSEGLARPYHSVQMVRHGIASCSA